MDDSRSVSSLSTLLIFNSALQTGDKIPFEDDEKDISIIEDRTNEPVPFSSSLLADGEVDADLAAQVAEAEAHLTKAKSIAKAEQRKREMPQSTAQCCGKPEEA